MSKTMSKDQKEKRLIELLLLLPFFVPASTYLMVSILPDDGGVAGFFMMIFFFTLMALVISGGPYLLVMIFYWFRNKDQTAQQFIRTILKMPWVMIPVQLPFNLFWVHDSLLELLSFTLQLGICILIFGYLYILLGLFILYLYRKIVA